MSKKIMSLSIVVRIVDRKKDLVKLQHGEYISYGKVLFIHLNLILKIRTLQFDFNYTCKKSIVKIFFEKKFFVERIE